MDQKRRPLGEYGCFQEEHIKPTSSIPSFNVFTASMAITVVYKVVKNKSNSWIHLRANFTSILLNSDIGIVIKDIWTVQCATNLNQRIPNEWKRILAEVKKLIEIQAKGYISMPLSAFLFILQNEAKNSMKIIKQSLWTTCWTDNGKHNTVNSCFADTPL